MISYFIFIGYSLLYSTVLLADPHSDKLLELSNAERIKADLPALCISAQLTQAAQAHAQEMAQQNYFSHTGLNGSDVGSRAQAEGYVYRVIGENISAGRDNSAETIAAWMDSPRHRDNMLNPEFTEAGFGYAGNSASDYQDYWVQVLGSPQNGGACDTRKAPFRSDAGNNAPAITGITPSVLLPRPAGHRQWLTIEGRNFADDARLQLSIIGGAAFKNRVPLSFSHDKLRYKINVGPTESTWEVRVTSRGKTSNPYRFTVSASAKTPAEPKTASPAHPPPASVADAPLLTECDRHFREFHLTQGSGQTAFDCYRGVLEKSPGNINALFGLEKIEVYYFARIKAASDKGLWEEAKIYMNRLHRVNPDSAYLSVFTAACPPAKPGAGPVPVAPVGIVETQTRTAYYNLIRRAAEKHGIPAAFIQSVIEVESGYDPNAVSSAGAMGLMQLMPAAAARFGVSNAYDPAQNINGGTAYLRLLWDLYDGRLELVLAAYNSGEGNVRKYGNTVPPSTRDYVTRIMNLYNERVRL
ncbi:MAG: transglycosylase SLT domain-containing protein [Gammaproteobacteria bacterium]|nr:transglycosylase SLT domain-containing protein [Gammaproteobacteria bacterium]